MDTNMVPPASVGEVFKRVSYKQVRSQDSILDVVICIGHRDASICR
jgi:hypothetical protein